MFDVCNWFTTWVPLYKVWQFHRWINTKNVSLKSIKWNGKRFWQEMAIKFSQILFKTDSYYWTSYWKSQFIIPLLRHQLPAAGQIFLLRMKKISYMFFIKIPINIMFNSRTNFTYERQNDRTRISKAFTLWLIWFANNEIRHKSNK